MYRNSEIQNWREEALKSLNRDMEEAFRFYSAGHFEDAAAELQRLLDELPLPGMSAAESGFRRLNLTYTRIGFIAASCLEQPQEFLSIALGLGTIFEEPSGIAEAEQERLALRLRFWTSMDSAGLASCSRERFLAMLADVPEESRDIRFWHDISLWAMRNRVLEALEAAVECSLMQQTKFVRESIWLRIYLMYRIVRQEQSEHDVLSYIHALESLPQIDEFRMNILPALQQTGSWNPTLQRALDAAGNLARARGFQHELRSDDEDA
ncbi:hypothetical protein KDL44_09075 [bacterium]|nr:hypothetical protein [bacterium]